MSPAAASDEDEVLEIAPIILDDGALSPAPEENVASAVHAPVSASGVDINAWFQTANRFYVDNRFDSALVYYTRIVDAGIRNSAVLYNMGNCHYRLQRPGLARLHYEKAAMLAPNDADIQANIDFIKSIIVDRTVENQDDFEFLTAVTYNIHTLLPLNIQLIILCALLFILSLIGSRMLMKKGLARLWLAYAAVLCALLIAVVGISAGYKIYAIESRQYAIIMSQSLDAKNQPAGTQTLFTVHEGTKLRVNKTVGEWSLVSLPNGASGWVTTASLGRI
jgi:tetratricopeptide (TPR) repeat protein